MCGFRWCGRQLCLRNMPISGVNATPRPTAVYASDPALPRRPQDSLPSCLLGFERTRLSLASSFQLPLAPRTGLLPKVGRDRASADVTPHRRSAGRRRAQDAGSGPVPGASPIVCHPSDRAPFPPRPPPPLVAALFGRFTGTTRLVRLLACSTAASAPRLPAAARDRRSDCGPDEVSQVPTRSFRA